MAQQKGRLTISDSTFDALYRALDIAKRALFTNPAPCSDLAVPR